MRWPKYWSFSFSIISSKEIPGLISFRMDWLDLLAVQGTLKNFLQHHSSKASVLRCSAFFMVQLSHPYMTTGKTIALTIDSSVSKVMPLLFNTLSMFVTDKESACNAEDPGLIPRSGRSPGEGHGNSLQYSCLENSMDREAWWVTVHGIAKSWTRLSDYHNRFVKSFLLRSECLLISWLQSPSCSDFRAQDNKVCHCFHCFHVYLQ